MLSPRESSSRECRRLDGLWRFRFDGIGGADGTAAEWWRGDLPDAREMAVPASYNDLVTESFEREHVGDVWYQRDVLVPATWAGRRLVLRCDAVTHRGTVWVDDVEVLDHVGGYTPFETDISALANPGATFRLTVRVNNELTMSTIPPGVVTIVDGQKKQRYFHDFFNYAGIHRSVWLYSTPPSFVHDITVTTNVDVETGVGRIDYRIETDREKSDFGSVEKIKFL